MDSFERDPFEKLSLPELEIPQRPGWQVSLVSTDERGPVYQVLRDDQSEFFLMSNRTFEQLDYYTSHKLLATIIKKIKENPGRKIKIVDVGGGVLSQCLRGMLRHPFLKGKIECVNIDPFAQAVDPVQLDEEGIDPRDLLVLSKDLFECSGMEESADILWSYQVLDNVADVRFISFVKKLASLLAPGGEAWINEFWRINRGASMGGWEVNPGLRFFEGNWLTEIANEHNVIMSSAFGETTLDGRTHLLGGSRSPFIYMGRQEETGRYPSMEFAAAFPEIREALKAYL